MQLLHPNTKISLLLFFTSLLFLINSCSTSNRSVREMRNAHSTNVKVNKPPKEALTKPLFLTTQKPNISLPQKNDVFSPYGQTIITEEVTYKNPEKLSDETAKQDAKPNLNEVQRLNEVTVTAKSLFAPERNGYIEMDFLINVPKEIISHNWRLTLQPQLLHNDSVVNLDVIIIKGDSFLVAQKRAYSKYDEYLKSIINPNKYSEVFFDKKATDKDILRRQDYYYKNYF